ncbi:MAG: helix-turn-helix transcriptional regulator [Muribaculaceae bacterium]|nr:helix-turn-helix transcriptional regulator [Muribaculaceae bacterium]
MKVEKENIKDKYKSPAYWTQLIQLMLYNQIDQYIKKNGLTKKEFAEKLGVSKGYVSQILNGDFDHRLSKLTELALACGFVPKLDFVPIELANQIANQYNRNCDTWKEYGSHYYEIPVAHVNEPSEESTAYRMK